MKEQKAMSQKPKGEKRKTGKTNGRKTTPEVITATPPNQQHSPHEIVEGQIVPVKKSISPNAGKKPGDLSHKTRKAIALVVDHGVAPKEAMILTGCAKTVNPQTISAFKGKVEKYSLQRPVMQKLAHQALRDTLEGKEARYDAVKVFSNGAKVPYQEVIVPSYTNKLAAAAMIYDRVDPLVRRSENLNVNVGCSPVDLEKYRNR